MPQADVRTAPGKSNEVMLAPLAKNPCWAPLESTYVPTTWPDALMSSACVMVAPGTSKLKQVPFEQTKPCPIGEAMPESNTPTKSPRALMPVTAVSAEPG